MLANTDGLVSSHKSLKTEVKREGLEKNYTPSHMSVVYSEGSQLNWAALTKEAYAIYLSVKKLAFYITDADITLRSDHLPLFCKRIP